MTKITFSLKLFAFVLIYLMWRQVNEREYQGALLLLSTFFLTLWLHANPNILKQPMFTIEVYASKNKILLVIGMLAFICVLCW